VVLPGLESPGETLFAYLTPPADGLRFLDLKKGGTGVAYWEEQLRVLV
jgi:hypothetical protein